MGLGQNAAAMLITRGLAETTRLATAMGAHPATLAGLAGLGDLVATCSSPLSRNRTFGTHLGRGLSVEQASAATRQTTEGVKSAEAILALAHAHDVEMPITDVVSALLHEKLTLDETAPALMQRPPSPSADPRRPDRGRTPHFALPFRRLPRHVSVPPAVQIAVTLALVAWMTTGFTRLPGRWTRWAMFCRATFTIIALTGTKDGRTEPVNVYDHLLPGSFVLGPPQLQAIVDYLVRSGRYDRIDGHGRVLSARGEQRVEATRSRVVLPVSSRTRAREDGRGARPSRHNARARPSFGQGHHLHQRA